MTEAIDRSSIVYQGYVTEQKSRALRDCRIAAVFAAVAIMLFSALDRVVYPGFFWTFLYLRIGVVFVSLLVFLATYIPAARRFGRELGMVQYVATALSVVLMVHLSDGYISPYYAGINVILIVFLAILPMDHLRATIVCGIIYAAYLVPILVRGEIANVPVFVNNNAFLAATIILALLSSYMSTRLRFREYAARHRLADANDELKKLDVLKSQFFANISHEVRTPLTSIIAPVQSLYQGDAGTLTDEQHGLMLQVYRNALRLLDMINQMLDFARFDARKMQLNLALVDIEKLVQESVLVFQDVATQKSLNLKCICEKEIPPIYLDQEKMERVLSNLIRNALKFTESGSVTVSVCARDGWAEFRVEDTGIGIPSRNLSTIFERFQQVDGSSTRRYEGTGLGLTIVKEAVELQHGTVTVESTPSEGTNFTVTIPMDLENRTTEAFIDRRSAERYGPDRRSSDEQYAGPDRRRTPRRRHDLARVSIEDMAFIDSTQPRSPVSNPEMTADEQKTGFRILYVEDNADLRSYVQQMLSKSGHNVTTAVDGLDGWRQTATFKPEVIVSDVMMPHLDGYDLLKKIRTSPDCQNIPVILTTAKSETDERIRGLENGADDYLAKPINIRELDARVRNLVTSRLFREAVIKSQELQGRIQDLTLGFSRSLELRDHYTGNHSNDVLEYGSIIAVADAWHAMIEDRPYRNALPIPTAISELQKGRGTHFDPQVVDAFLRGLSN